MASQGRDQSLEPTWPWGPSIKKSPFSFLSPAGRPLADTCSCRLLRQVHSNENPSIPCWQQRDKQIFSSQPKGLTSQWKAPISGEISQQGSHRERNWRGVRTGEKPANQSFYFCLSQLTFWTQIGCTDDLCRTKYQVLYCTIGRSVARRLE